MKETNYQPLVSSSRFTVSKSRRISLPVYVTEILLYCITIEVSCVTHSMLGNCNFPIILWARAYNNLIVCNMLLNRNVFTHFA